MTGLVEQNLGLVPYWAKRLKVPRHRWDEAISDGHLALVQCAQRFDPTSAAKFGSWASHRIRGAILDGMRTRSSPRSVVGFGQRVELDPNEAALAVHSDPGAEDPGCRVDLVRILAALPDRDRTVLEARFFEGATVGVIGDGSNPNGSRRLTAALRRARQIVDPTNEVTTMETPRLCVKCTRPLRRNNQKGTCMRCRRGGNPAQPVSPQAPRITQTDVQRRFNNLADALGLNGETIVQEFMETWIAKIRAAAA